MSCSYFLYVNSHFYKWFILSLSSSGGVNIHVCVESYIKLILWFFLINNYYGYYKLNILIFNKTIIYMYTRVIFFVFYRSNDNIKNER
jgi:hypothetical protein